MKILLLSVFITTQVIAQDALFLNPIIPGGYPDPSICLVEDTFYVVNSSFEYFPGLPIHKSTDLVNWELAGYALHREEQCSGAVNLSDVQSDGGIHAPTIRYHDGLFYIITTNVYYHPEENRTDFVNFIVTATDIEGPWSDPHVLEGAPGIDPDIFFDGDDRVWYVGTHSPENPRFPGEGEIWLQEIDLKDWKLKGERSFLWRGACGGVWVEGPHMYKKDGRYYLMVAEGGTSFNHAVMIAVSDNIRGPYLSNERNPILTSRHLSYDNWVHSTGHADLVELPDGRWFMVALGIRGDVDRGSNMGRETFLLPVTWESEPFAWKEIKHEWPVCAPLTGKVVKFTPLPFTGKPQQRNHAFTDDFSSEELHPEWIFRRVPKPGTYSLTDSPGHLRLFARPDTLAERGNCSLMGLRQKESDFDYSTGMLFETDQKKAEAGMCLFQKDNNYIAFTVLSMGDHYLLRLRLAEPDVEPAIVKSIQLEDYNGEIELKVVSKDNSYHFSYSLDEGKDFIPFAVAKANHILSRGYTGACLGIYATGNGTKGNAFADFDRVSYRDYQRENGEQ